MSVQNDKDNHYLLNNWRPENKAFWENKGQAIARRNLWISVACLLLAFCVWMLFSAVAVNLNKVGFHFTTDQLFLLTALPSLSGAILRVPYSFMVPLFGGRYWTVLSTVILIVPCIWLGVAIQNITTPFWVFIIIALLCGFAGANFASSMGNISFFFPKAKQGSALGVNGGLGNLGVSVMQMVAPAVIFLPLFTFLGVHGVTQPDGSTITLSNSALVWVPLLLLATVAAWFGMNDIAGSKASIRDQLPVLKRPHMWLLSLLYLATFGSFIGFSAGFAMLAKTQFPDVNILQLAFFGPFIGAIPATLLILIQNPIKALWFVLFVLVLQQLDGNIIGPKILGNTTGLSSFWVLFAILLFGGLWGFVGMIVGVPLFAVIYDVIKKLVIHGLQRNQELTLLNSYHDQFGDPADDAAAQPAASQPAENQ